MPNDLVVAGDPLATAHNWIARGLEPAGADYPFFQGYAPLAPAFGPALVRAQIKQWAQFHVLNMSEACSMARAGWDVADQAVRELIAEYTDRGDRLPTPLAAYNIEILSRLPPHRPKGQKKTAHVMQDIFIAVMVGELIGYHGLKPTRRQSSRPSACSVVAQALRERRVRAITEKNVERVWNRYWPVIGDFRRPRRPDF